MAENDVKVTLAKIEEEIAAKLSSLSSSYITKNKLVTQEIYNKKASGEIEDFLKEQNLTAKNIPKFMFEKEYLYYGDDGKIKETLIK